MRIIPEPSLSKLTTIKLGGTALALIVVEKPEDLLLLPEKLKEIGGKVFWLGNGSNLLAKDGYLPITLVRQKYRTRPIILQRIDDKVKVKVEAGYPLPSFLGFCLKNSLSGMEGLRGIPGTIGGAIKMNAGSFGANASDCLTEVEVMVEEDIKSYKINELIPKYRRIEFPFPNNKGFILNATFTLTHCQKHDILKRMNQNFFEKKFRQPLDVPSAGCIFKNPLNALSAGILLDRSGFKGKRLGGMEFSARHANFLVNTGSGNSAEALELILAAEETVRNAFGITLEREVEILP